MCRLDNLQHRPMNSGSVGNGRGIAEMFGDLLDSPDDGPFALRSLSHELPQGLCGELRSGPGPGNLWQLSRDLARIIIHLRRPNGKARTLVDQVLKQLVFRQVAAVFDEAGETPIVDVGLMVFAAFPAKADVNTATYRSRHVGRVESSGRSPCSPWRTRCCRHDGFGPDGLRYRIGRSNLWGTLEAVNYSSKDVPSQRGNGSASMPMRPAMKLGNVPLRFVVRGARVCELRRPIVGGLIYLIGLIVVVLFILSFLGLR
jgi:hypothetical protein